MRFVPIKSADAQSVPMLHRARNLLVRQRTAQFSAMRAHLAEYGVVAPRGIGMCATCLRCLRQVLRCFPIWHAKCCS